MATVEKEKEQKQDALNQSGCCGGVSKSIIEQQNDEISESAELKVKVEKKEGEQGRSCCG